MHSRIVFTCIIKKKKTLFRRVTRSWIIIASGYYFTIVYNLINITHAQPGGYSSLIGNTVSFQLNAGHKNVLKLLDNNIYSKHYDLPNNTNKNE